MHSSIILDLYFSGIERERGNNQYQEKNSSHFYNKKF